MPELVQPPQVNAKCDVVMKLSVFGTRTDIHTHTSQNLYILATRAVTITAHRDRNDSVRAQLPINAEELAALTFAPSELRFKCDFGGDDHGREAG